MRDLIDRLRACDPDAPVFTIDSDNYWPTFVEVGPSQIGEPYEGDLRRYPDTVPVRTTSAAAAAWTGRVVVVAGGTWSRYPNGDAHAGQERL